MTNALIDAAKAIGDALDALPDVRVYREPGESIEGPALAISVPSVEWNGPGTDPTDATFTVGFIPSIVRAERLNESMMGMLPAVVEALDSAMPSRVVVRRANPGTWPNGGGDLPAYLIEIEVAL